MKETNQSGFDLLLGIRCLQNDGMVERTNPRLYPWRTPRRIQRTDPQLVEIIFQPIRPKLSPSSWSCAAIFSLASSLGQTVRFGVLICRSMDQSVTFLYISQLPSGSGSRLPFSTKDWRPHLPAGELKHWRYLSWVERSGASGAE